jgi:hypothetical protein
MTRAPYRCNRNIVHGGLDKPVKRVHRCAGTPKPRNVAILMFTIQPQTFELVMAD